MKIVIPLLDFEQSTVYLFLQTENTKLTMSKPTLRRPFEQQQPAEVGPLVVVVPPAIVPAPAAPAPVAVPALAAPTPEAGAAARPMPAQRVVYMLDANDSDDEEEENRVIEPYIEVTFESLADADEAEQRYSEKATIKTPRDEHSGMRWVVTRCNLDLIFAISRLVRYLPDKLSIALNENLTNLNHNILLKFILKIRRAN